MSIVPDDSAIGNARFPTTRGSAVRGATSPDPSERARSWAALVAAYWKAAYKYVRMRWRASREDAEDATQGFFEGAIRGDAFASFDPARARFRTFFRVCLDRHVMDVRKATTRQKRGGGATNLSLDFGEAERELSLASAATWESPEEGFDREWRRSLFTLAVAALEEELATSGKRGHFELFAAYDLVDPAGRPTYDALAASRGVPVTTVTNHLAFARRELRRLVLEKLAEITSNDAELDREAAFLLAKPTEPG